MGVILDTNWRFWNPIANTDEVGWPNPVTAPGAPWPYTRLSKMAAEFQAAGFSAVKLFPACLCGSGPYSDGYDKNDDYNLNGTAFGSAEMLRQCVAQMNAHGMEAYGDLVLHQYGGGPNSTYKTKRFPKTPTCFVKSANNPNGVAVDTVPDTQGNFPFGDMASYEHSIPHRYMHDGAMAATKFLVETTGFDGLRIDDAKGTYVPVVWDTFHQPGKLSELFLAAEYFDGSPEAVSNYINGYMTRRSAVYDFAFKFNVGNICNNNSRAWMGALRDIGYVNVDPSMCVTFVESADSDNSIGQQTIWNKILGYAIMLTYPGYPQVYYRDWSSDPRCYNLKKPINNLIWIHEKLAQGDFVPRLYDNPQVFAHERMGYGDAPGCVALFNNDQYNEHTVTVQTNVGAYQEVHEYTGLGPYNNVRTDGQGRLTATLPRNINGYSYQVYGIPLQMGGTPVIRTPRYTTQTVFGAGDLVMNPAVKNAPLTIAAFDIAAGSTVRAWLTCDQDGWAAASSVELQIVHTETPDAAAGSGVCNFETKTATSRAIAMQGGWYEVELTGTQLPPAGSSYEFKIEYMAPHIPSPGAM